MSEEWDNTKEQTLMLGLARSHLNYTRTFRSDKQSNALVDTMTHACLQGHTDGHTSVTADEIQIRLSQTQGPQARIIHYWKGKWVEVSFSYFHKITLDEALVPI